MYCNDIATTINSKCPNVKILQFADDTKIMLPIKNYQDKLQLQEAINALNDWSNANMIPLNHQKTQMITFAKIKHIARHEYYINNNMIERVTTAKDLGLIYDNKLSFANHYQHVLLSAKRMLGISRRFSKQFPNPHMLMTIFKTYILPKIEFGIIFWIGLTAVRIEKIEGLLRMVIAIAFGNNDGNAAARRLVFGINTIAERMELQRITTLLKITRNHYRTDCRPLLEASLYPTDRRLSYNMIYDTNRLRLSREHPIRQMMTAANLRTRIITNNRAISTIKQKIKEFYDSRTNRLLQ